ncbi:hypothetical protein AB0O28_02120 [Microbispora sp. NPDC088329]|uniref:hypothetical protein n=1 Tax=Microbispora sp. NPDC088329 TaxID=3154869 RepID=UPI003421FFF2
MTVIEPTSEQSAVRVLFILDRLGDECGHGDVPASAVKVIRAQRRLQKLDFLVRNPDYLADAFITGVERKRLPVSCLADAKDVLDRREPDLHTYRMLRNKHGAYEPLDDALSVLRHLGLIKIQRAGRTSDTRVRRRDYYLLESGRDAADQLRRYIPLLAWYDEQAAYVGRMANGLSAEELKNLQYENDEYSGTPIGQLIGGIEERVRSRLDEALAREGLA